jgi:hypothetical protein
MVYKQYFHLYPSSWIHYNNRMKLDYMELYIFMIDIALGRCTL